MHLPFHFTPVKEPISKTKRYRRWFVEIQTIGDKEMQKTLGSCHVPQFLE